MGLRHYQRLSHQRFMAAFTLASYLLAVLVAAPLHRFMHEGHDHFGGPQACHAKGPETGASHCHASGAVHAHGSAEKVAAVSVESDGIHAPTSGHGHDHVCSICAMLAQSQLATGQAQPQSAPLLVTRAATARATFIAAERIVSFQSRAPPAQA